MAIWDIRDGEIHAVGAITPADLYAMYEAVAPIAPASFLEAWPWTGTIDVTVRDRRGRFLERRRIRNQITTAGRNLIAGMLKGATANAIIGYVALGSDNGSILPVAASNTALGAEQFRKAVTAYPTPGAGANITRLLVSPFEANYNGGAGFQIQEIGWFAGPAASSTPGSGVLVARIFYSRQKSSQETLQIDRTDQF